MTKRDNFVEIFFIIIIFGFIQAWDHASISHSIQYEPQEIPKRIDKNNSQNCKQEDI